MVIITSFVALLVVGTEGSGQVFANRDSSGHVTNRGINVQTDTSQDQGCEGVGGTSGITNACTATSGRGSTQTSTQTSVTFGCGTINFQTRNLFDCSGDISFSIASCTSLLVNCTTNTGVQLTSCMTVVPVGGKIGFTCTLAETGTVPGTGITQSGGVSG
ncbi:MAG TPA: hypothetical protein VEH06_11865 [Candidatus Bathyarchaeia archaeon]|nr:hypothetical protein [Candidatus Bathyarchaeia archaeon]